MHPAPDQGTQTGRQQDKISSVAAYLLLVSVLVAVGGWASEQVFLARRWPRRFLWLTVLAASVLFPLAMTLSARPATPARTQAPTALGLYSLNATQLVQTHEPEANSTGPTGPTAPAARSAAAVVPHASADRSPARLSWDQLVSIVWLSSTMATVLWYLLAGMRLARFVRSAPCATVEGVSVRITPAGPAVFGVFRPVILWPLWLDEAPAETRAAAIAHEQQHLVARDPLVLAGGLILVALAPWNPALWWQLQRMRFAMEADCDQRVVDGGTESQAYALALLQIAERRAAWGTGLAMLMSAPSWLERRVRVLLNSPVSLRTVSPGLRVALVLAALLAAGELPTPSLRDAQLRTLPPGASAPVMGSAAGRTDITGGR